MSSRVMTKIAQDQVHPAQGAVYNEILTLPAPGTSEYIIMPYHEIYDMAFVLEGTGTDFLDVTIDTPAMIAADAATWETWNETDPISRAITGFRLRSTVGAGKLRATVKTRP